MTPHVMLLTTLPDQAQAQRLARRLVEEKLAGCVQVAGPVHSVYRWRGAIESAAEWLCLIKTAAALSERATRAIEALHPYDTPEVVVIPISGGSPRYLAWLDEAVEGEPGSGD